MEAEDDHDVGADRDGSERSQRRVRGESQYTPAEAQQGMRTLNADLLEDLKDPSKVSARQLVERLDQQQEYYEAGKNTDCRIQDANNLLVMGEVMFRISKKERDNANTFDINEFFDPLRKKLGFDLPPTEEEDEDQVGGIRKNGELGDWEKIGWIATKRMRTVMGMESINGMMAVEHKKRVQKRRAKAAALGAEVRPVELKEQDMAASKNETTENVKSVYKRLRVHESSDDLEKDYAGVNFYQWIINPHSFAESVENLFYTSFLIREGKLAIEFDKKGVPRLFDAVDEENDAAPVNMAPKIQEVLQFDMATWRQAIELFGITTSMIPSRGPVNAQRDSWTA